MGATMGAQWWQHKLQSEENRRNQKAAKFEALVCAIYEFDDWHDRERNRLVYGSDLTESASPFPKLLAIAAVSFPQFLDAIARLDAGSKSYQHWMATRQQKRLEKKLNELNEGFGEAYAVYSEKREALLSQLLKFSKSEFGSS